MDTDKKKNIVRVLVFAVIILAIVIVMSMLAGGANTSTKYDTFAQCLSEKKTKFYGAFWCQHCQAQKKMFGGSVKHLPYIECSTPDGKGQTQQCIDEKIQGYPTWEFADGSRMSGKVSFEILSEKSGCALPTDAE